uniref:Cytochrome c6 n=1 Tax=Bornetia secundiflora TaxID=2575637 RepID=A0A4D6WM71_9FLOR|nr:cytochrome c553 [Bornetia secundiflora]
MKFLLKFLIICSIVFSITNNSTLAENADLDAGESIFNANCAACHAGGNNAVMPEKNLRIETLNKYNMSTADAIITQVTNGKNAMPAFGERLSSDDIVNVASFVLNQSTTESW